MPAETAPSAVPIAPDLFTWPSDEPRLVGGVCAECGAVAFPRPTSCSRCTSERIDEHVLARRGTLWSWTIQRFQPKEPYAGPEPFEPYGVGYVDLAGEVIVEGRLDDRGSERAGDRPTDGAGDRPVRRRRHVRLRPLGRTMSTSTRVAIVGIGMHPFGRTDGVSGRQQAVHAARLALADAGITWDQAQFAFGGSRDGGDADTLVNELGLTGLPFVNVSNGCATGGSALTMADRTIRSGVADLGLAIGFDKHPRGAFNADPETLGIGAWYGQTGLMLTTQFFALKIQRYMHLHGISPSTLAKVAVKAYENGAQNPNAWRRTPLTEEQVAASKMVSDPLTQYMFCSPGEGAVALVLCRAEHAHRYTGTPVFLDAVSFATRHYGSFEVFSPSLAPDRSDGPTTVAARAAVRTGRHRSGGFRRRPDPGHRIGRRDHAHGGDRPVQGRRAGATDPGGRHPDRWVDADQHRRRMPRQW